MAKTYDPACYDLAEHFLRDEPVSNDQTTYEKLCDDLAKEIQQTIDNWFAMDVDAECLPAVEGGKQL